MSTVKTVLGEVAPLKLGFVDIHDHIWKKGGLEVREDKDFAIDNLEKSKKEVLSYAQAGGGTIVDMQPLGVGRGIQEMREIAKDTGVHVIAVTGFHKESFYDSTHFVYRYQPDEIEDLLVSEVKEGIEVNDFCGPIIRRSESKAGAVKAASSYYKITPLEDKLIKIAARTSVRTGAPLLTHTQMGTMGLEQALIMKGQGLAPEKICIGHMDRDPDPVYHLRVLREGVYVQYDCVARVKYHPIIDTANLIIDMVRKGYEDKILIGGDWGRASYLKAYNGAPGLEYLPKYFQTYLKEYGVEEKTIHKIFYENPMRFLSY